jgi:hypothetical protein
VLPAALAMVQRPFPDVLVEPVSTHRLPPWPVLCPHLLFHVPFVHLCRCVVLWYLPSWSLSLPLVNVPHLLLSHWCLWLPHASHDRSHITAKCSRMKPPVHLTPVNFSWDSAPKCPLLLNDLFTGNSRYKEVLAHPRKIRYSLKFAVSKIHVITNFSV